MLYATQELDPTKIYHLMAQTIIPRPIAWIVTENSGVVNIAPFSFFTPLSASPATVVVSIGKKSDGSLKDTIANIQKTQKCTICMVDEYNLEKMHFSSKELPRDVSEADEFDIATRELFKDFPPAIENATVSFACTFNQMIDLKDTRTQPIVLNVKNIYIDEEKEFKPVARVSREYAFLSKRVEAPTFSEK